jgi:hypothetical protein
MRVVVISAGGTGLRQHENLGVCQESMYKTEALLQEPAARPRDAFEGATRKSCATVLDGMKCMNKHA